MSTILELKDVHTFYGSSHILFGVSLWVEEGEAVCLLGRNGVGKTTTLRSVMGLTPPRSGSINFRGLEIAGFPPYKVARLGIGFVPEDRQIFPDLTVRGNLELAARGSREGKGWSVEGVYELFPKLKELDSRHGRYLSGGEQQMLTIGRTLMTNPAILLLDEASEGLAPVLVEVLLKQMKAIAEAGCAMLISEQNLEFAIELSKRAYVLEKGMIRYEGSIEGLQKDEEVRSKYLQL